MLKLTRLFTINQVMRYSFAKFASVIKMPSLSPTMSEGGIVEWHKNEGDKITAGDLICDIQTDKAVVGMEAEEDGILAKIIKPKDTQNIQIGEIIGLLADFDEDWKSVAIPSGIKEEKKIPPKVESISSEEKSHKSVEKLGPAVRRLLDTYGLKSESIDHSGPHSILIKSDVLQHIDKSKLDPRAVTKSTSVPTTGDSTQRAKQPKSKPSSSYIDVPISDARAAFVKRITEAKSSVPHFYTSEQASISDLIALRNQLKAKKIDLSINDFVVKACSLALRLVPSINSVIDTDGNMRINSTVDISVRVPFSDNFDTPVVFGADKLSIDEISNRMRELIDRARDNKLQPQESLGGTFTVLNLEMFGVKEFTSIINSQQAAILAVGAGVSEAVFDPANPRRPRFDTRMRFTLSADARIVDEISAAEFVRHVKSYLENPKFLLADANNGEAEHLSEAWTYR